MDVGPAARLEGDIRLADGRQLGFAEYGRARGRAVLWFPGTPGGRGQVPPAMRRAAQARGVRLIILERPGLGSSTAHQYGSLLGWADDVRQVADQLDIERFASIGLSGGGPYVLATAYRHPGRMVAGIVQGCVPPAVGADAPTGSVVGALARFSPLVARAQRPLGDVLWAALRAFTPVRSQAFDLYLRWFAPADDQRLFGQPEIKAMFLDDLTRAGRRQAYGPFADLALFTRDWGFALRDVRVPIRFWHGDDDNFVPLAHITHMAARMPDARVHVLEGQSHLGGFEATGQILDEILALWDGARPVRAPARRRRDHAQRRSAPVRP